MNKSDEWVKVQGARSMDEVIKRLSRSQLSANGFITTMSQPAGDYGSGDEWVKVRGAKTLNEVVSQVGGGTDTPQGDEWVKLPGVKSVEDILYNLNDQYNQQPVTTPVLQPGRVTEYSQVIVVVPPPALQQQLNTASRAVPNDYVINDIMPTTRDDYRRRIVPSYVESLRTAPPFIPMSRPQRLEPTIRYAIMTL